MKKKFNITRSEFAEKFLYLNGKPFSLDDYSHMREIYNDDSREIVLKFSRQCVYEDQIIRLLNGVEKKAKDIQVGDILISYDEVNKCNIGGKVINVWSNGIQPIYHIKAGNRDIYVTGNHPIYTDRGWVPAEELKQKDKIAILSDISFDVPEEEYDITDTELIVAIVIYIFAEYGSLCLNLSSKRKSYDIFINALHDIGFDYIQKSDKKLQIIINYKVREFLNKINYKLNLDNNISQILPLIGKLNKRQLELLHDLFLKWFKTNSRIYVTDKKDVEKLYEFILNRLGYCTYPEKTHYHFTRVSYIQKSKGKPFIFYPLKVCEVVFEGLTIDIEIETIHTFYINNILTHNTSKSTTLAMMAVADSAMISHFKTMYVSPTVDQTKIFSHDRLTPVIEGSPLINEYYLSSHLIQNVFMKKFLNGSEIYLKYALLSADRLRGISADQIFFDETQDLREDILPIVKESLNRSLYKRVLYVGTPKRTKGTLANIWFRSTMNEYVIKCEHCTHWNILNEDNIGLKGLICSKCGFPLNLKESKAEWVSTYSLTQQPLLEGYRICALHFAEAPWVNWKTDILDKRETSPSRAIFYNEVLGLEYDDGVAPITKEELVAACDPNMPLLSEPDEVAKSYSSIMGIDYGPINSENSNTVISVVQKRAGKYYVVYMKKFVGKEADYSYIHNEVPKLMQKWNCLYLAADYGMGEASNSEIRSRIGYDKVIAFQHNHSAKEFMKWNEKLPAFILNRNATMTEIFKMIKHKEIIFPAWEYTEYYANDILNIQSEYNEENNTMKYVNIGPDDFFHATLYAVISYLYIGGFVK